MQNMKFNGSLSVAILKKMSVEFYKKTSRTKTGFLSLLLKKLYIPF